MSMEPMTVKRTPSMRTVSPTAGVPLNNFFLEARAKESHAAAFGDIFGRNPAAFGWAPRFAFRHIRDKRRGWRFP